MSNRPSGTVTFLFSDIEGSTRLAQQFPAAWPAAKARHHALMRTAIESHNGYIFQIIGDAFCASFQTSPAALAAALDAQRALHAEPWGDAVIHARMGIHTGTATVLESGDYDGYLTLVRVQRIMSAAHGGQVLISREAADLIQRDLPAGIALHPIGTHQLKDLAAPEHLHQLVAPGLPADFPPLKTADVPNNLPRQMTSFIGRESEVAEIRRLLAGSALVTLTGPGGVGKTRLSLQVAAEERPVYPDGVWFVELASLTDPALIADAIASAAGVHEEPSRPMLATLGDHLRARTTLLVIDNCEHLVAATAHACDSLLHAAPKLKIVATSREALAIAGEQVYAVPSLNLPAAGGRLDELSRTASVQLFVARAQAVRSVFALTDANSAAVAQICLQLDGIPLAIELAAARIKALSPEQIAARLGDRFHLLTGGSRTALPRQQTLRALVDWSYDLLTEPERVLLRRLSVFAGGWTLEGAEAVCAGDGIEPADLLDLLTRLVDRSLVVAEDSAGTTRYHMLETIHQFAREKLDETGEERQWHDRLLEFCAKLAERTEPKLNGSEQIRWLQVLDAESGNIRAAIDWAIRCGGAAPEVYDAARHPLEMGLRIAGALWWYWYSRAHWAEATGQLEGLLEQPGAAAPTVARARALISDGFLLLQQGENAQGRGRLEEALQIAADRKDDLIAERALELLGFGIANAGDHATAMPMVEQAVALARRLGDQHGLARCLVTLGQTLVDQGDYERAQSLLEEGIPLLTAAGDNDLLAWATRHLGYALLALGDSEGAMVLYLQSLNLNVSVGHEQGIAASLAALAGSTTARGQFDDAAALCGAVQAQLDAHAITLFRADRRPHERNIAALRARMDAAAFAHAWSTGQAMTLSQAVAAGRRVATVSPVAPVPPSSEVDLVGLTPREMEVLRWLARGLTDAEIADQLVVSARTVNAHLRSIYSKLDVTTRTAAVRAAIELKLS